jgi:hypothetical protein
VGGRHGRHAATKVVRNLAGGVLEQDGSKVLVESIVAHR